MKRVPSVGKDTKMGANMDRKKDKDTKSPPQATQSLSPVVAPEREPAADTWPTEPGRPAIEAVRPQVDSGRFPAKATVGHAVTVEADVMADGHDLVLCDLRFRHSSSTRWERVAMEPGVNDHWHGSFPVDRVGLHQFELRAEIDRFGTWRRDLAARIAADQDVTMDLVIGAQMVRHATSRAKGGARRSLELGAEDIEEGGLTAEAAALDDELAGLVRQYRGDERTVVSRVFDVWADRPRAGFGSWYELFPRSMSPDPSRAGTLADVVDRLPYLERLGIDVLYLPPIHPIGNTNRKGKDGDRAAGPDDPGSPWAIGGSGGGHLSVHPELGTIEDVDRLVAAAAEVGIEIALDLAFQCSPDHPWVRQHPEWFAHLPDGSIRFAENPPKRYEDIYPLDFDSPMWRELWEALRSVVRFWIGHGIKIFRVDNPHTKPFSFWEWLIATVRAEDPDVLFLSEAFTRPRVMERLGKVGFTQSYTYFTWRTDRWAIEQYFSELTSDPVADYLRPNLWPTTPDILPEHLQSGGTPAFVARLVLAATLAANYGIYGPSFELQQHQARSSGSEEFANSEKYAIRHWDLGGQEGLADLVAHINAIRRANPALQTDSTLRFHAVDNPALIAYSKTSAAGEAPEPFDTPHAVLVVVNLDPCNAQAGWIDLDLSRLGVDPGRPFVVHDLLTDAFYRWEGSRNFVRLDPTVVPAHVFAVRAPEAPPPPQCSKP